MGCCQGTQISNNELNSELNKSIEKLNSLQSKGPIEKTISGVDLIKNNSLKNNSDIQINEENPVNNSHNSNNGINENNVIIKNLINSSENIEKGISGKRKVYEKSFVTMDHALENNFNNKSKNNMKRSDFGSPTYFSQNKSNDKSNSHINTEYEHKINQFKEKLLKDFDDVENKLKKSNFLQNEVIKTTVQKMPSIDSNKNNLKTKITKKMTKKLSEIPKNVEEDDCRSLKNNQSNNNVDNNNSNFSSDTKRMSIKELDQSFKINHNFASSNFISLKEGSIFDHYTLGQVLGEGSFGKVNIVIHKVTGMKRAMKSIKKKKLLQEDQKKLFSEMGILKKLDHPNIIKLYELFEDKENYYLITENLQGGELSNRIKKNGISEKVAAKYMRQVLAGLVYLHSKMLVHRDIKPDNILFDSNEEDSTLKIIDFGTCRYFSNSKKMSKVIGTPYYIAPETLKKSYSEKCDIWSCGVMLYQMIFGKVPFTGRTESEIYTKIKNGNFTFPDYDEDFIVSLDCINLIRKMLVVDYEKRISAKESFQNLWIQKNASSYPLDLKIMNNLSNYKYQSKLNTAILTFIAAQLLTNKEKEEIGRVFQTLDKTGDGILSKDELSEGFIKIYKEQKKSKQMAEEIIKNINSKTINFTQFVIYTMNKDKLLDKKKLDMAFKIIDMDGNGIIDKKEMENLIGGTSIPEEMWRIIINKYKKDSSEMSYENFVDILYKEVQI